MTKRKKDRGFPALAISAAALAAVTFIWWMTALDPGYPASVVGINPGLQVDYIYGGAALAAALTFWLLVGKKRATS